MTTNVFYLAPPAPPLVQGRTRSAGLRARLRLLSFWYRLRRTAVEVTGVLRRFGRPAVDPEAVFEQSDDLVVTGRRVPGAPARIIDLAAARARLRS